jgi:hypothetical protein
VTEHCPAGLIESVDGLTTQQIGQLANHEMQSTAEYAVVLWTFDPEDAPRKESKIAIGFLIVSRGDIGDVPVGALIWSSEPANLKLTKSRDGGFDIHFSSSSNDCLPSVVTVRVQANGVVKASERVLGKLP